MHVTVSQILLVSSHVQHCPVVTTAAIAVAAGERLTSTAPSQAGFWVERLGHLPAIIMLVAGPTLRPVV
ncbi:hypothetical protein Hamer_G012899 [Homarus americanus]|uniref:Uncharacterized protein n=1 Tax=Homarus americanus TaxID=6706 RepID=A0A8J5KB95_HOMAM|nr:hypothetical protein Hamer_G012899 [Homarus americanus]